MGSSFLPGDSRVEEPHRLTPQAALRIAVLGSIALLIFGALFLRLWALEVLSGHQYLRVAQNNQLRAVRLAAPRGPILDRNGRVLVDNIAGTAVQLWPADLPKTWPERRQELRLLSQIVHTPVAEMLSGIESRKGDPLTPVTVKEGIHKDQYNYLSEHKDQFPGLQLTDSFIRHYPYGATASQLLGYVSEISPQELKHAKPGYRAGDKIGQTGIESSFDAYLRGQPGLSKLRVDSLGNPRGTLTPTNLPQAGQRDPPDDRRSAATGRAGRADDRHAACQGVQLLRLLGRERRRDRRARPEGRLGARARVGADVRPERLLRARDDEAARCAGPHAGDGVDRELPVTQPCDRRPVSARLDVQAGDRDRRDAGEPDPTVVDAPVHGQLHRAGRQVGPEAGLQQLGPGREHGDGPADGARVLVRHLLLRARQPVLRAAGRARPPPAGLGGTVRLRKDVGARRRSRGAGPPADSRVAPEDVHEGNRQVLLARRLALEAGRLDPARDRPEGPARDAVADGPLLRAARERRQARHAARPGGHRAAGGGGRCAASAGTAQPQPINVDPGALAVVRQGLLEATHASFGTSAAVFGNFPIPIAGKTGTAEKSVDPGDGITRTFNQAWWCGYGPADNAKIVVCAVIENGGHGGETAAPAALKVFEEFFHKSATLSGAIHSD